MILNRVTWVVLRYDKLYKNYVTFRHCYINRFYKYIVAYLYTELFELKHYGLYFCFELAKYCILIFWNYILHYVKLYWSYSCILGFFEFSCIKDFWTYNCNLKWRDILSGYTTEIFYEWREVARWSPRKTITPWLTWLVKAAGGSRNTWTRSGMFFKSRARCNCTMKTVPVT